MKKITIYVVIAILSLTLNPLQSKAATAAPKNTTLPKAAMETKVALLTSRLYEINAIDKSTLKASDKKALRKEVKAIKEQMRIANSGGIYISAGAVILIIILVIILL